MCRDSSYNPFPPSGAEHSALAAFSFPYSYAFTPIATQQRDAKLVFKLSQQQFPLKLNNMPFPRPLRLAFSSVLLSVIHFTHAEDSTAPYLEENGLIVIEAEDQSFDTAFFKLESSIDGYSGTGYLVGQINSYNTPGKGIVSCPIKISQSGRYQLSWKSRITIGDSNTDANDTWVRLLDSNDTPIAPVVNDMHASVNQWHKSYMNNANGWSYDASNKDNDPHSISWQFEAGNTYTLQLSVRSEGHGVDRIVLWDTASYDFANKQTGKGSKANLLNPLLQSLREKTIAADSDNDGLPDYWESEYGSNETSIDPDSDADSDTLPALVEFATGTNPSIPNPAPTLNKIEENGVAYLSFNYTKSITATDHVTLTPFYSIELKNWSTDNLSLETDQASGEEDSVSERALLPLLNQETKHFFKLIAEKK